MCGRYTLTFTIQELQKEFKFKKNSAVYNPSYNIAPMQNVPVVVDEGDGVVLDVYRWGLIPHWSKNLNMAFKMINARAETVAEKPAYKDAFLNHRCLIPASEFYEWKKEKDGKKPYYIHLKDRKIFAFAGISSQWKMSESKIIKSCSIITTTPNKFIEEIHDRMPIIMEKKNENKWINAKIKDKNKLMSMLRPYPTNKMEGYMVSEFVNSPKNNSQECINPV